MYVAFWTQNIWEESPYDCEGKKNLLGNHFLLRTPTFAGELFKPVDLLQHAEEEDGDGSVLQLEVLPHLVITPIVLGLALSSSRSADRLPITSDPQKPRISHCLQLASNRFVPNFVFCSSFTSFGN